MKSPLFEKQWCVVLLLLIGQAAYADVDRSKFDLIKEDDKPKAAVQEGPATQQPVAQENLVDVFNRTLERAKTEKKDLVIWVMVRCLPCEKKLPNCYHVYLEAYNCDSTPRVIVAKYRDGELFGDFQLPGLPTVEQIQALLTPPQRQYQTQPQYQYQQQYYQPQQQYYQPQNRGFSGGGFRGGFGGGGSCGGGG